jgi:putative membrane protein
VQRDQAQVAGRAQSAARPGDDREFVARAAMANMAGIQLGHLAAERAQRQDVRAFAQRMIDDHLKAQKALADAASGAGVKWPTQLDARHQQLRQRLSSAKGEQFDREYLSAMIDGHREVERQLVERVGEGRDESAPKANVSGEGDEAALASRVDGWAARTLPDVRAHLAQAEEVAGGLESSK